MGCYQPELTEEEWNTAEISIGGHRITLPRNGVYISKERCQQDFPNHKIVEYSGDRESLEYIDMIQDVPKIKRLQRNKRKTKK